MSGFPNELSHSVKELDHVIPLQDWVFPVTLSPASPLKRYKIIAPLADAVSTLYAFVRLGALPHDIRMKPFSRFAQDFKLDSNLIHGVRTAAYLNWRFIYNPMHRYSVFEFVDQKECIGYCVYAVSESAADDFICTRRQRECIRLLVEHCRSQNLTQLNFRGANLRLGGFGFFRRPSSEDCILTDIPDGPRVPQGPWMLTLADRDV